MKFVTRPNSWVSQDAAATAQLTYGLQLNPAPLTVSITGRDPILGSLEFVITNPTASAIALNSVAFTIQVGTTGSNLTTTTANVGTSVSDTTDWQIQSPGTVTSGPAVYTLSPQTGKSVSVAPGASIVVELYNFPTVENAGNTTITVKETAGTIGFTSFLVTTFPSGFYFNGLSATVENGSQLVPVAQVATGAPVTLVWNSSVVDLASFTIYYSNAAQGQQSATPTDTGLWTSGPLSADTVFTIVVTVSIAGGTPLTAALSTAVSVQNPSLIAASLTAGTATVNGLLTVTGATQANPITATGLTVNGNASATGSVTAATGTITGDLTANTETITTSLRINGTASTPAFSIGGVGVLNVDAATVTGGRFTVQNNGNVGINRPNPGSTLDINGSLAVSGGATVTGLNARGGQVAMIGNAQGINPGSWPNWNGYNAPTDGYVIGFIGHPSSYTDGCICWGYGQSGGASVSITGGNVGFFGPGWSSYMCSNPQTFTLPVAAGANFYIVIQQNTGGQQSNAPYQFYWVPVGAGNVSATVTQLEKPGPDFIPIAAAVAGPSPFPSSLSLIEAIEELLEKKFDEKTKKKLLGGS